MGFATPSIRSMGRLGGLQAPFRTNAKECPLLCNPGANRQKNTEHPGSAVLPAISGVATPSFLVTFSNPILEKPNNRIIRIVLRISYIGANC